MARLHRPPAPDPFRILRPGSRFVALLLLLGAALRPDAMVVRPSLAASDEQDEDATEARVSLPTDRLKERQLDRARRLVAEERWSDAVALLDEMLAGDRDFFLRPQNGQATWQSIKAEATRLIGSLPPAGRAAYDLQFRARADRLLDQAIASGDSAGIVAVARRWFHTQAGRRATLLAALEALEADQPLAAAAWLERLAVENRADFEPTLSVMRAIAWWRAGDRQAAVAMLAEARRVGGTTVRVGGRAVSLPASSAEAASWLASVAGTGGVGGERRDTEWWLARGDAARNAHVEASRPLLVPRYRVPLTRHPEEARLLEKRRRLFADRDAPLLPAGMPLAVDGMILAHSPLGLLAVDFSTGKRVWVQGDPLVGDSVGGGDGGEEGPEGPDALQRVFSDATSGMLSSNGRLVYAVEAAGRTRRTAARGALPQQDPGNVLAAYDLEARGQLVWRRPAATEAGDAGDAQGVDGTTWHLGAPLAIGDQLFVLAEEKGEVRLDVLGAADGRLAWSQPLAELDEEQQADRPETSVRRASGLSPTFSDGVLVCPTGAGTVVAVDLATRTLLWAYNYAVAKGDDDAVRPGQRGPLGGMMRRVVVNGVPIGESSAGPSGWRDACPIVSAGRVLLTPIESESLHCLDLRTGAVQWTVPRGESLYVAGVVEGRALVVGAHGGDSLSLDTGKTTWAKPLALGSAAVSGRGVITPHRLFLPLDTPEVVEIDLASGGIAGRSPARGGAIPGNLLAYRGEVISQGVDSLDVFHQVAPLEAKIETASHGQPADPWVLAWRGQLDLDQGRIAAGLRSIAAARRADPSRLSADVVADALLFGMRRDFGAAAPLWREISEIAGPLPRTKALQCIAIDNLLAARAIDDAWRAFRTLLELPPAAINDDDWLIEDLADPALVVSEPRWIQGRFRGLLDQASPSVRQEIDAFVSVALDEARGSDPADVVAALERVAVRFAAHPVAVAARGALRDAIDARLAAPGTARDAARPLAVRRALLATQDPVAEGDDFRSATGDFSDAWPLGRVEVQRSGRTKPEDAMRLSRTIPIPLDMRSRSAVPGLQIGCDIQAQSLVLTDGFGRRMGDPVPFDAGRGSGLHPLFQPLNAEATALGSVLLVRSGAAFAAFDVRGTSIAGGPQAERLWLAAEPSGLPAELPPLGFQLGRGNGRQKRNGHVPLGARVTEPDVQAVVPSERGMLLLADGAVILRDSSLECRDPVTGAVNWRRARLPVTGDLVGDEASLCICPRDGRRAAVFSTADGRLVRTVDVPAQELRLAASGCRLVAIGSPAGGQAGSVSLEWIDPARDGRMKLGDFASAARAAQAGPGLLAVLEPDGALTLIDVDRGTVRFRTPLPAMPAGLEHLQVIPWQDRFLVIAGRRETPQEQEQFERLGHVTPLPQMVPGDEATGLTFTGSIWAVSRSAGESLWPVPATIVRHCLHRHQAADLPVLVFARHVQSRRDGSLTRLGILALDKRTGHAVYADDKIPIQPHVFSGCDVVGDPERHTLTLGRAGGDTAEMRLRFTGAPMAPRPPYQAATKPAGGGDLLSELETWLQKALAIPLPF